MGFESTCSKCQNEDNVLENRQIITNKENKEVLCDWFLQRDKLTFSWN